MVRLSFAGAALSLMSASLAAPTRRADVVTCLQNAGVPTDLINSDEWTRDGTAYNLRMPIHPAAIAVPETQDHIVAAVRCGAQNGVAVSAKGGGHSYTSLGFGGEDGHLVLEMDRMYNVSLDTATGVAKVQPGTRLGHLATELFNQGKRGLSHGTCPGVGAVGHSLHGGYGMVSHKHGLALDWIAGATVVLANGTVAHCSLTENADLFWAIRGAGASFGVVAELEYNTFEVPAQLTVFSATLALTTTNAAQALVDIQDFGQTMPPELSLQTTVGRDSYSLGGSFIGTEAGLRTALQPLVEKTGASLSYVETMDWTGYIEHFAGVEEVDITTSAYSAHDNFYASSMTLPEVTLSQFQAFADFVADASQTGDSSHSWFLQMDAIGGSTSAVSAVGNDATAYPHRDKVLLFQLYDFMADSSRPYSDSGFAFVDGVRDSITGSLSAGDWGMYVNYADSRLSADEAQALYWGSNLPRLQELKAVYDPGNLFRNPQSVQPATA
ncbi:FAD/FMN-containing dehydrogenase [Geosmithia morbida]|uniref:FAD/FMN-containing dehydrogenase n=1 Tax=Geosmithia morbida TaxID=1094350 RepID=A0A9P4YSE7_9HYPO|nr:FAD/FMN-containing dehydrogenase [Geosmithia morbida]KAF4120791.1 FAD/FMN-containing dehydrogenase [Geosmithia morbida]